MHVWMRPALIVAGALILVAAVAGFSGHELAGHIESLESWITGFGLTGMLVFAALVVVAISLFLPESVFGVAAGVLFGLGWGIAVILLANFLAAALQYGLAYRLLREPIQRKLGTGRMSAMIQRAAGGGNFKLQLLLRLAPLNQTLINYSLGAAGIRFPQFMAGIVAMSPALIVEVYLGHTGKHLALIGTGLKHSGWRHDVLLFTGLLVIVAGVVFASRNAYRTLMRAAGTSE